MLIAGAKISALETILILAESFLASQNQIVTEPWIPLHFAKYIAIAIPSLALYNPSLCQALICVSYVVANRFESRERRTEVTLD